MPCHCWNAAQPVCCTAGDVRDQQPRLEHDWLYHCADIFFGLVLYQIPCSFLKQVFLLVAVSPSCSREICQASLRAGFRLLHPNPLSLLGIPSRGLE